MRRIIGLVLVALALGTSAAPAGADERTTGDPRGGASSDLDLHRVKVSNTARGVRVVVRMSPVDRVESRPVGDHRLLLDTRRAPAVPCASVAALRHS